MAGDDAPQGASLIDPRSWIPPKWMSFLSGLTAILMIITFVLVVLNYVKLH